MVTTDTTQAIIDAARAGDLQAVRGLLAGDGGLARASNDRGETPLIWSIYAGAGAVTEALLAAGAEHTVFTAAAAGATDALRHLLEDDAELVKAYSYDGWTPLHLAAFLGHTAAMHLLINEGADLRALSRNENGNMPLHAACAGHRGEAAKLLVEWGADVNARAAGGWTPLHLATDSGQTDLAAFLLDHGADATARSDDGQTPLAMARKHDRAAVIALLTARGISA